MGDCKGGMDGAKNLASADSVIGLIVISLSGSAASSVIVSLTPGSFNGNAVEDVVKEEGEDTKWTNFGKKTSLCFEVGFGPINENELGLTRDDGEVATVSVEVGDAVEITGGKGLDFGLVNADLAFTFNTFFLFRFDTFSL